MQFPNARILIFAKAPEPGRVKTRLIPTLGAEAAASLYEALLDTTVARTVAARLAPVQCCCAPHTEHPVFQAMTEDYGISLTPQRGEDLGERMEAAARSALNEAEFVLLIGGDCPVLQSEHLQQALSWLASGVDAVIGPAEDGGYVLLGLRQPASELFKEIPWGGDGVLDKTRERLDRLGWRWQELPLLWDLDRPEDLLRYRAMKGGTP